MIKARSLRLDLARLASFEWTAVGFLVPSDCSDKKRMPSQNEPDTPSRVRVGMLTWSDVKTLPPVRGLASRCEAKRVPALHPDDMRALLLTEKRFTNGADATSVADMYSEFFNSVVPLAHTEASVSPPASLRE